jgi:hypothetical protein
MALIACPDCGRPTWNTARVCDYCGRPNRDRVATATDSPTESYSATVVTNADAATPSLPYFEVGLGKFVVMSLVTLGLYELYWVYSQWRHIKLRTMEDLSPFWRTLFAPLWGFSLFEHVRADAIKQGVPIGWSSGSLGLAYLVLSAAWRLPDPWWLLSLVSFLPVIPSVRAIAAVHDKLAEHRDGNSRFSAANIAGVIFGGIVLVLAVLGSFTT